MTKPVKITVDDIDWSVSPLHVRASLKELRRYDKILWRTWWRCRTDLPNRGYRYDLSLVGQLVLVHDWRDPTELAAALRLYHDVHCRSNKSRSRSYIARTIAKVLNRHAR